MHWEPIRAWFAANNIGWKEFIGWCVTLLGFAIAGFVAFKAQEHRRRLDDDAIRKVLRAAVEEGMATAIVFTRVILRQLKAGPPISREFLDAISRGRISYDRNKDNMVHWKPEKQRRRIQRWFRDAEVTMPGMEIFTKLEPTRQDLIILRVTGTALIKGLGHILKFGTELFNELGFDKREPGDPDYDQFYGGIDPKDLEPPPGTIDESAPEVGPKENPGKSSS